MSTRLTPFVSGQIACLGSLQMAAFANDVPIVAETPYVGEWNSGQNGCVSNPDMFVFSA